MNGQSVFQRLFASVASKGKKTAEVGLKRKIKHAFQTRSKRLKKPSRSVDDSARFKDALFSVDPSRVEFKPSEEELGRREIIAKAWSRYCGAKDRSQQMHEYFFMASKVRALAELARISPQLAEKAQEIDYKLPPQRRMPSLYPPNKLPFI